MRTRLILVVSTAVLLTTGVAAVPAGASGVAAYRVEKGFKLNNLRVTPGETFKVSTATVCTRGYATKVRSVSQGTKNKAYAEYGIRSHKTGQYEVDHLISLELGGDNSLKNLWPEPDDLSPTRNTKDNLEDHLHALVCSGQVPLGTAQHAIATDWVKAYAKYMPVKVRTKTVTPTPTPTPPPTPTPTATPTPTPTAGTVVITSIVDPVAAGSTEQATGTSTAGDTCDLEVTLPSGRQSTASGLGTKTTGGDGTASWTWTITSNTGSGTATATLSCGAGTTSRTFTID